MADPTDAALAEALEATWPPEVREIGAGLALRAAPGAGSRVNSARILDADPGLDGFAAMRSFYEARGAPPLAQLRDAERDGPFAKALERAGYRAFDATDIWIADSAAIAEQERADWERRAETAELGAAAGYWEATGTSSARRAVMARAPEPRTAVLLRARSGDVVGALFVAVAGPIAFVHALHVLKDRRRRGAAAAAVSAAARFARAEGCETIAAARVRANPAAGGLFKALGFVQRPGYAYLRAPERDEA